MGREERVKIIREISRRRASGVICYLTGDRENVNTRIAPDVTPVLHRHLELLGPQPRIDLFLYTRGGDVLTPVRLVHLIREYAEHFAVLVPYRAYSAGTLLCLGADEVVMGKMGELGPIDPSVVNAFNPQDPVNACARVPVNVEDVYSYLALAREKAGVSETLLPGIFNQLGERIHPLALGNVHRNYLLIRSLAHKLLQLRRQPPEPDAAQDIVDCLTEKFYAHNYMITRSEAAGEIGLPVTAPERQLETMLWRLYRDYADELALDEPFDPEEYVHGQRSSFKVAAGLVESVQGRDCFVFSGIIDAPEYPHHGQINVNIQQQRWHRE
ncbi:SDH family Clp fold serine proteinase [Desulfotomaculum copahuensis]|uniref:Serine protease n=1 Tax=Desulfotomaculum copahuensis TaxID=1838280 RepID=A0A1B7LI08_9FIRM|nr:hypothetical protein [Desulfotomaculum copahuensis]OAT85888.1 hypothetical protein A6M21_05310 [Desulfotomaculum copahuensis]